MAKNDPPLDTDSLHVLAEDLRVLTGKLRRRL
ncbi:MAG: MarR family transcriptional regulator, partial [Paraburkholderia graminis]